MALKLLVLLKPVVCHFNLVHENPIRRRGLRKWLARGYLGGIRGYSVSARLPWTAAEQVKSRVRLIRSSKRGGVGRVNSDDSWVKSSLSNIPRSPCTPHHARHRQLIWMIIALALSTGVQWTDSPVLTLLRLLLSRVHVNRVMIHSIDNNYYSTKNKLIFFTLNGIRSLNLKWIK